MRKRLLTAFLSTGLLCGTATLSPAATVRTPAQQARHHRHRKTAKRVGVGAVGGAAVGALTGHPLAGAAAGAGAGAVYDHHKKKQGK